MRANESRLMGIAILLASACLVVLDAQDRVIRPFGLKEGLSLAEVRALIPGLKPAPKQVMTYVTDTVPRPDARRFERYELVITPRAGLCSISAIGVDVKTSVFGREAKSAADEMAEVLTSAYGVEPQKLDFLQQGSLWNEPEDWMMGLLKKDRTYMFKWELWPNKESAGIYLGLYALSRETAYVNVSFAFQNYTACEAEQKAAAADPYK